MTLLPLSCWFSAGNEGMSHNYQPSPMVSYQGIPSRSAQIFRIFSTHLPSRPALTLGVATDLWKPKRERLTRCTSGLSRFAALPADLPFFSSLPIKWTGLQTVHELVVSQQNGPNPKSDSHFLSGWPNKSPNFLFTTKMVFPKSLKFMNSGSEL